MTYKNFKVKKISAAVIFFACLTDVSLAAKQIDLSKQPFPTALPGYKMTVDHSTTPVKVVKSHTDQNQMTHIRVKQLHANVPVWGGDAVIHLPAKLAHSYMSNKSSLGITDPGVKKTGFFYAEIEKDIGKTLPEQYAQKTKQQTAINTLKNEFINTHRKEQWKLSNEKAELIVYIDEQNQSRWAYKVSFNAVTPNKIPMQPYAIIDADTQKIYTRWDNIKRAGDIANVKAIGYGGNPLLGQWHYGKDKPHMSITREIEKNKCFMDNGEVAVIDKADGELEIPGEIYNFACEKKTEDQDTFSVPENGLYGQANGAYSPINDALFYGGVIKNMYKEWYGLDVLTQRGSNNPLKLNMNIISFFNYENAFWESESQQMYFGLGGSQLYPLVTLGIAAHEISHGFTDQHSDLVYKDESGAINEAFSDMVIPAITYYFNHEKDAEWGTGWEVLKSNRGKNKDDYEYVRYFDVPSKDRYSIDHVEKIPQLQSLCKRISEDEDEYQSCFVHLASGVFNKAFYQLASREGWNPKLAFEVVIKANQDYWTPTANFQQAACGVKSAAADLAKKNAAIKLSDVDAAFETVGISLKSC